MVIRSFGSGQRLAFYYLLPYRDIHYQLTAAVFLYEIYTFRRIIILQHHKGRTRFPYTQNSGKRFYTSRKQNVDKILPANAMIFEITINSSGHLVQLAI